MTNKTIKVQNRTGSNQSYALFNEAPRVEGHVQGKVWSNIFRTLRAPNGATASFSVSSQYFAFTGTSEGRPDDGVGVDVSSEKPITLGSVRPDGAHVPGSTVQLSGEDNALRFGNDSSPDSGFAGAFSIRSNSDFTSNDANRGNYIVGLGGSRNGQGFDGPLASFVPEPAVQYQILPSSTWYLTFGDYREGSLISKDRVQAVVAIDFNNLPPNVTVVHDEAGNLELQRN
ncbi:Ff.00g108850.m01.CDS01 [Fusarium sp. VM40]|nr:Ff.00g108850.m01.CDS01 [Fusarium sp. VM40]